MLLILVFSCLLVLSSSSKTFSPRKLKLWNMAVARRPSLPISYQHENKKENKILARTQKCGQIISHPAAPTCQNTHALSANGLLCEDFY